MNTDDLINAKMAELVAKKEAIIARTQPFRDQYNELRAQIDVLVDQQKAIGETFRAIEVEEGLFDVDQEIAKVALLKNTTKRMSDN